MNEPQETAAALKLWIVMSRALRSIERHLQRQVAAHGLGFTEFGVLEVLFHKGYLPIGEIGNQVLLTSGSMTYVIDKLVQRGLIKREACPQDRRVIYAALTEEGRALMDIVFPEHAELNRRLMRGLGLQEKEVAIDLLKQLGLYADSYADAAEVAT